MFAQASINMEIVLKKVEFFRVLFVALRDHGGRLPTFIVESSFQLYGESNA